MRAFLIIIFSCLIFPSMVFANAKTELDKIIKTDSGLTVEEDNSSTVYKSGDFQNQTINNTTNNVKNNSSLTNYQYDESNYHYYKYKKYVLDNENYAQSGRMKY